jgi:hypothetical protein
MAEYDVRASVVGRRYACDECGAEMVRDPNAETLWVSPPRWVHVCGNGHRANLLRTYPGFDTIITTEPVVRKRWWRR